MSEKPNLWQRLHAVMEEVGRVPKQKKQGMNYQIVTHDDVTAVVRDPLLKHGIYYSSSVIDHGREGNLCWALVEVVFVNVDEPAERVSVRSFGYGVDNQDKGPGKAMSYATKYALLKGLGLETGEDVDNDRKTDRNAKHSYRSEANGNGNGNHDNERLLPGVRGDSKTTAREDRHGDEAKRHENSEGVIGNDTQKLLDHCTQRLTLLNDTDLLDLKGLRAFLKGLGVEGVSQIKTLGDAKKLAAWIQKHEASLQTEGR